jgi:hypothetical protein
MKAAFGFRLLVVFFTMSAPWLMTPEGAPRFGPAAAYYEQLRREVPEGN